jgi:hypothetical protein
MLTPSSRFGPALLAYVPLACSDAGSDFPPELTAPLPYASRDSADPVVAPHPVPFAFDPSVDEAAELPTSVPELPAPAGREVVYGATTTDIVGDDTYVYIAVSGTLLGGERNEIVRVDKNTLQSEVIVANLRDPRRLTLHGAYLYWVDFWGGQLGRFAVDGSSNELIAVGLEGPADVAVDDASAYVTEYRGQRVVRIDLATGTRTTLSEQPFPKTILDRGGSVLVVNFTNEQPLVSELVDISKSSGRSQVLATENDGAIEDMVERSGDAYWVTYSLAGSYAAAMNLHDDDHAEVVLGWSAHPLAMAADDSALYVSVTALGLWKIPLDGDTPAVTLDRNVTIFGVSVDEQHVYYSGPTEVYRLPLD